MSLSSVWADLKQQTYLGDEGFVERMQMLINENKDPSQIPPPQARPRPKQIHEYLSLEKDRTRAIVRAYQSGGYTSKDIADCFTLHYSTVSVIAGNPKSKT